MGITLQFERHEHAARAVQRFGAGSERATNWFAQPLSPTTSHSMRFAGRRLAARHLLSGRIFSGLTPLWIEAVIPV